jgi:hypothetical protein
LEEKGETSASVNVGEINGDGLPDIVLGKGRHWPLYNRVLLNDGKGGFTASNLGTAPGRTYSAALADIDRDGDLDIIVSNDAPDRKVVFLNDGKGHFTETATFGRPNWTTRYVTLADLNGDGYPDIIVANRGDYPDPVDGKPGKGPPNSHFELRLPQRRHGPLSHLRSAPDRIGNIHRNGGPRRRWSTRPVRPAPRWRPEHHFVERWEGSFPDSYESWAGHCLDPHGRRRRL